MPCGHLDFKITLHQFRKAHRLLLFPNTPIEVKYETSYRYTPKGVELDYAFHFYCEGDWSGREVTEGGLKRRLRELITIHRRLWPEIKINPEWPGWEELSMVSLHENIA